MVDDQRGRRPAGRLDQLAGLLDRLGTVDLGPPRQPAAAPGRVHVSAGSAQLDRDSAPRAAGGSGYQDDLPGQFPVAIVDHRRDLHRAVDGAFVEGSAAIGCDRLPKGSARPVAPKIASGLCGPKRVRIPSPSAPSRLPAPARRCSGQNVRMRRCARMMLERTLRPRADEPRHVGPIRRNRSIVAYALPPVEGLLLHARAPYRAASSETGWRRPVSDRDPAMTITQGLSPAPTKACRVRGGRVEEVPLAEASLLPLDEKPALPRHDEERLLAGLDVVEAALARFQDGDVDAELRELGLCSPVLVLEVARGAPALGDPPLGVTRVHDEPTLGDGCEP